MSGLTPEMIDAMVAAGLSQEQMATILKAHLVAEEAKMTARRAKEAEKKRKQRANKAAMSPVVPGTAGDTRDNGDSTPLSPPLSPTPPNSPPISPRSDDKSSGAAAPNSDLGSNIIVLADPRSELFGRGLKILIGMTGRPETVLRSVLGRWLKTANDDAVKVLRVIEDTARDKRADPIPWIEMVLRQPAPKTPAQKSYLERGKI